MKLKYRVLSVDETEHSMVVRYFTDTISEQALGLEFRQDTGEVIRGRTDYNITVWQVPAPTGDELHDLIVKSAPKQFFDLLDKVADPGVDTTMSSVVALLGKEVEQGFAYNAIAKKWIPTELRKVKERK